ncbi:hypothetical protein Vafri_5171, partial [Volvox africanus]
MTSCDCQRTGEHQKLYVLTPDSLVRNLLLSSSWLMGGVGLVFAPPPPPQLLRSLSRRRQSSRYRASETPPPSLRLLISALLLPVWVFLLLPEARDCCLQIVRTCPMWVPDAPSDARPSEDLPTLKHSAFRQAGLRAYRPPAS